jgi:hypothetical protein
MGKTTQRNNTWFTTWICKQPIVAEKGHKKHLCESAFDLSCSEELEKSTVVHLSQRYVSFVEIDTWCESIGGLSWDGKICRFRSLRYGKSTLKMLLYW